MAKNDLVAKTPIEGKYQVVVDGDMSPERLEVLIALEAEEEALDYKSSLDLSGKKSGARVEIVRDIVAMANTRGGYIVLGVEETKEGARKYEPKGMDEAHIRSLDIDRLKQQVESYVAARIDIQLRVLNLARYDNKSFGMIYTALTDEPFIIFEKPGQYEISKRKSETLFRAGDILVRKGARSERADQNDMRMLISRMRRRERDRWTEEVLGIKPLTEAVSKLVARLEGRGELTPPEGFDEGALFLGMKSFEDHILDLLRIDDEVTVRRYLNGAAYTFYTGITSADVNGSRIREVQDNRLLPLLDNLLIMGVVFAQHRRKDLFDDLEMALYRIYERANSTQFPQPEDAGIVFGASWVWQEIMKRVYIIGAVLVLLKRYDWIPVLARQPIEWDDYWGRAFWSRHALTISAREGTLQSKGWCVVARDEIEEREILTLVLNRDYNQRVGALCQFDFVQCVHVVHNTDRPPMAYPSFGIFHNYRTEPIIHDLIKSGPARAAIPEMTDDRLASIIRELDQYAGREFFMYSGWHSNSWSDASIKSFLNDHPSTQP